MNELSLVAATAALIEASAAADLKTEDFPSWNEDDLCR